MRRGYLAKSPVGRGVGAPVVPVGGAGTRRSPWALHWRTCGAMALAVAALVVRCGGASVFPLGTLQGDVSVDFLVGAPGVYVATDPNPPLQFVSGGTDSGWNIVDVRFAYDTASDTGYFGR